MGVSKAMHEIYTELDIHVRVHGPFVSVHMLVEENSMADVFFTFLVDLEPQQPDNSWVHTLKWLLA
jgi:hypothetical protein